MNGRQFTQSFGGGHPAFGVFNHGDGRIFVLIHDFKTDLFDFRKRVLELSGRKEFNGI